MKNVLISGASKGIGAEIARLFSANGYGVIINYNTNGKRAELLEQQLNASGGNALAVQADVSDACQVQSMLEAVAKRYSHIDVLVCNAGIANTSLLTQSKESDFDRMLDVNLKGVYNLCKFVTPKFVSRQQGSIVTIGSFLGMYGGSCESVYSMTKGGVIAFSLSLAKELAPSGVTVNCVCPGLIDTEMNDNLTQEDKQRLVSQTPLMRMGKPEDVAQAVFYLANASFVTGVVLPVTGGLIV